MLLTSEAVEDIGRWGSEIVYLVSICYVGGSSEFGSIFRQGSQASKTVVEADRGNRLDDRISNSSYRSGQHDHTCMIY